HHAASAVSSAGTRRVRHRRRGPGLMRLAFNGDTAGRAARTAQIRDPLGKLDKETRLREPLATEYDLGTGYQQWSATYDQPLRLFPIEEPPMRALIETLP